MASNIELKFNQAHLYKPDNQRLQGSIKRLELENNLSQVVIINIIGEIHNIWYAII